MAGLAIAIIILYSLFLLWYFSILNVNSEYFSNNGFFSVLKKYDNQDNAQELLQSIDTNLLLLIDNFNFKYSDANCIDIPKPKKELLLYIRDKLNNTYKSSSLQENFPTTVGKEVSYNVNKGETISICLRDYNDPNKFHEFNDLMFVSIHELAHSCNQSYGHDKKFWKVFRILLEVAIENNLYKSINYQDQVTSYCSMKITYSPVFDKSLDDNNYFNI